MLGFYSNRVSQNPHMQEECGQPAEFYSFTSSTSDFRSGERGVRSRALLVSESIVSDVAFFQETVAMLV
jgi:hypothetical protein